MHWLLGSMADHLQHRGPDARGIWSEGPVGLGHRRLAILDLSEAGAQPMQSCCGRYVIAFNGEIYNHLDLRQELAGAVPGWRGHSDTETLLAGIAHWGLDETLRRTAGMFALALWDRRGKRLFLARDRIGEKPLYWGWAGKSLIFASELKALRQVPDFPHELCETSVAQYLRYSYVPAPRSIHPGIYKLEPGCILEVHKTPPETPPTQPLRPGDAYGSLSLRRYWSLNEMFDASTLIADERQALQELEEVLMRAVQRQMISDVSLGAFLSGGVDSSLVAALMQRQASRPIKTFTIGFENPAYNEAPYAADVARHLGTDHTEMTVTDADVWDVIPKLPKLYDEPFADSSQIPTFLVSKLAREHVTVALSGDAGDELFGGYNRYLWGPRLWGKIGALPSPLRRVLGAAIGAMPTAGWDAIGSVAGRVSSRAAVSRPGEKAHKLAHHLRHADTLEGFYRGLISTSSEPAFLSAANGSTLLDDPLPEAAHDDPATWMMVQDMRTYLPDDILCKVDRAAMGVSLETRVPFLDPIVMALSARLPTDMKIRAGVGKWPLRKILYRHVPQNLIDRPKIGFGIPLGEWLRGPLLEWAEDLLFDNELTHTSLLDQKRINTIWSQHLNGSRPNEHQLWSILMLHSWLRDTDT